MLVPTVTPPPVGRAFPAKVGFSVLFVAQNNTTVIVDRVLEHVRLPTYTPLWLSILLYRPLLPLNNYAVK